jgi:hypothetical protein
MILRGGSVPRRAIIAPRNLYRLKDESNFFE